MILLKGGGGGGKQHDRVNRDIAELLQKVKILYQKMAKAEAVLYFIFKGLLYTSCLCFPRYSALYFPRDLPIKAPHSLVEKEKTH